MGSLIIQITPQGLDFRVTLSEENHEPKSVLLARANLTGGTWTALIPDGRADVPTTDIVQRLIGVLPMERHHPDFSAIGETLYNWLLRAGPIRERWKELPANTAVYLDVQDEALARLPRELVRSPDSLRLAVTNELHRVYPKKPRSPRDPSWPFRILIVVGCSSTKEAALGIDGEVRRIEREFLRLGRSVDVHCLCRPEFKTLCSWIREYHPIVFHFAGHGAKVPGHDDLGLLIEVDAPGNS